MIVMVRYTAKIPWKIGHVNQAKESQGHLDEEGGPGHKKLWDLGVPIVCDSKEREEEYFRHFCRMCWFGFCRIQEEFRLRDAHRVLVGAVLLVRKTKRFVWGRKEESETDYKKAEDKKSNYCKQTWVGTGKEDKNLYKM